MGAHVSVPMYRRALPQRLRLEAARCADCGVVSFPPRAVCATCRSPHQEAVRLSGRGTLHAWTRIEGVAAPPEFGPFAAAEGAYHVGIVDLEEGPRITTMLTGLSGEPDIGMPLQATIRRLYEEEGVIRYGFKFAPAATHPRGATP